MPHMANINWLEMYLLSNVLLMIMMSINSSKTTTMSTLPMKLKSTTKKWKW